MYQPLKGIKILDCSRLLPYQYCTLLLGDLGAEVLKVEEPGRGDYGRWVDLNTQENENISFIMANRNKKSMTLNLKKEIGKEIFKKLVEQFDVLFETFRPGVMERLSLGYDVISKINPRIIYCSGSGYGQTGPYRLKVGHDINYISVAGILGATGMHMGQPIIPGIPIADMAGGGLFPAFVILAALIGREKTVKGQYIDIAMTDVATSINLANISTILAKRERKSDPAYDFHGRSICYNIYKTKDGKFISIGALENKFWTNFCGAVGREGLIEKQYQIYEDGEETTESLKALFASKTQAEWIKFMEEIDFCFAPVNTVEETLKDPHLMKRGIITEMQDPKRGETFQIGFPALFSEELNYKRSPAPTLGQNTLEILESLGYTSKEIENLKEKEVI